MMGEYVIPQILGYGQVYMMGNALVLRFLEARNWPAGSAYAAVPHPHHVRRPSRSTCGSPTAVDRPAT